VIDWIDRILDDPLRALSHALGGEEYDDWICKCGWENDEKDTKCEICGRERER
jgi:hypothetical protein